MLALPRLMRLLWTGVLALTTFGAQGAAVLTTLHSFEVFTNGAFPTSAPVQGSDGSLYGTTSGGGTNGGIGIVFKIGANGVLTTLYSFTGGNDGAYPSALLQGRDGDFYGMTASGGANGDGTVFRINTNGELTSLHSFTGNDGAYPQAGLSQGSDGNFYGTAEFGGTNGAGTVFRINTNGVLTTLYFFTGGDDGANPQPAPVQGSDGNFYGTTEAGGMYGNDPGFHGTVFKISTNGALTTLYSFTGGEDGGFVQAGLAQGSDGNFYGTTVAGSANNSGTVFQISTNGALTTLYSFTGGGEGGYPRGGLAQGSDGNFYGTTEDGGANNSGTIFQISTSGALTTLYSFSGGDDGAVPIAGLMPGGASNFYGTTYQGGTNNAGTVYQITYGGALTSLYSFLGGGDGAYPEDAPTEGSDGNFYGTTVGGSASGGSGTIFQISSDGALSTLYSFTGGDDGGSPFGGLIEGSDGDFYGTTERDGAYQAGTVFKISTNGAFTSLYSFTGGDDGGSPFGGLIEGSDGSFYGTTEKGGTHGTVFGGYGNVFKFSTNGTLTRLYSFTGGSDGLNPEAGLVQGSDGDFYGTTEQGGTDDFGAVFKISANGTLTRLYSFTGGKDGTFPVAGLVQGSDGSFYGTTFGFQSGADPGTVFKISTNGALTTLYSFTGGDDGRNPQGTLVQGSDGDFYGTTSAAGAKQYGTVFEVSTNGTLTTLYTFTGGRDGALPHAGLVLGSDGNFYGTTYQGGDGGAGTVFRLTVKAAEPAFQAVTLSHNLLILTWSTEPGGTYQLQYSTDLSSSKWMNLANAVIANGATLSATDSVTNGPERYYRIVLSP